MSKFLEEKRKQKGSISKHQNKLFNLFLGLITYREHIYCLSDMCTHTLKIIAIVTGDVRTKRQISCSITKIQINFNDLQLPLVSLLLFLLLNQLGLLTFTTCLLLNNGQYYVLLKIKTKKKLFNNNFFLELGEIGDEYLTLKRICLMFSRFYI